MRYLLKREINENQIHQCDFCGTTFPSSELLDGRIGLLVVREDTHNPKNNVLKCDDCHEQELLGEECPEFFEL